MKRKVSSVRWWGVLVAIAIVALLVSSGAPAAPARFKIAVVSDIGGRGDLSFNDMAFKDGGMRSATSASRWWRW